MDTDARPLHRYRVWKVAHIWHKTTRKHGIPFFFTLDNVSIPSTFLSCNEIFCSFFFSILSFSPQQETANQLRERIRNFLKVPEKDFEKWRVCHASFDRVAGLEGMSYTFASICHLLFFLSLTTMFPSQAKPSWTGTPGVIMTTLLSTMLTRYLCFFHVFFFTVVSHIFFFFSTDPQEIQGKPLRKGRRHPQLRLFHRPDAHPLFSLFSFVLVKTAVSFFFSLAHFSHFCEMKEKLHHTLNYDVFLLMIQLCHCHK